GPAPRQKPREACATLGTVAVRGTLALRALEGVFHRLGLYTAVTRKLVRAIAIVGASALLLGAHASAQTSQDALLPHATWNCGMPEGIPLPEAGSAVFTITIPLERAVEMGRT